MNTEIDFDQACMGFFLSSRYETSLFVFAEEESSASSLFDGSDVSEEEDVDDEDGDGENDADGDQNSKVQGESMSIIECLFFLLTHGKGVTSTPARLFVAGNRLQAIYGENS